MDQSQIPWTDEWLENRREQAFREVIGSSNTATITISGNSASGERPSIFRIQGQTDAEVMCIGIFAKCYNYFSIDDNKKWLYIGYLTQWLGLNQTMCREEITNKVTLARSYYQKLDVSDDQTFVTCLFLDGCCLAFMIALLQTSSDTYSEILKGDRRNHQQNQEFSFLYQEIMQKKMAIKLDMLKANNQIPWFVVEAVFRNSDLKTPYVAKFALSCFGEFYPNMHKDKVSCNLPTDQIKHLLHLFLWSRTSGPILVDLNSDLTYASGTGLYIPSATDLQESATEFKALIGASIGFTYNTRMAGKMQVAPLHLFRYSIEIFSNLIDFEQKFLAGGLAITSYIACMVRLLQSEDDVKLLRKRGIVGNTMKTNKEVLEFMEKLRAKIGDAFIEDDLCKLSEKVLKHHQRGRSRQYATFKKQYCSNIWITLSVIAGFFIFIFTALQAVYGILGYYYKH